MDKLEPLIRHRFWVLFGLAVPLALAGYYIASGDIKAATEARGQELQQTLEGVPSGETEPNATYAAELSEINQELQAENDVEVQKLWEAQTDRMHWPTVMVENGFLPNEYRGEIARSARGYYTEVYPEIVKRVWERVEPVVPNPPPPGLDVNWDQKVLLFPDKIPRERFDRNRAPSNKNVWDAQEDVWLLELLFDAIARANKDATFIGNAPLRRIDRLMLTGGNGDTSSKASSGGQFGEGGMPADFAEFANLMDSGGGSGKKGGRRSITMKSVSFNIAEEIGPTVRDPEASDGRGGGSGDEFGGNRPADFAEFAALMDKSSAAGRGAGSRNAYRYIGMPEEVEQAPFRERAFYISAIMLLPEIPDVFAELSSSEWPIRIGRFHVGPNPYKPTGGRSSERGARLASGGAGGGMDMEAMIAAFSAQALGDESQRGFGANQGQFPGGISGGFQGGSLPLPRSMRGPDYIDPDWFADPDLAQVDFMGVITMYNPITDDSLVPTGDGSSVEETEEAVAEQRAAAEAATEGAGGSPTADESQPGDTPSEDAEAEEAGQNVPSDGDEASPPVDGRP